MAAGLEANKATAKLAESGSIVDQIDAAKHYTTKQVCDLFSISNGLLRRWRHERKHLGRKVGPAPVTLGGQTVRYSGKELLRWYAECMRRSALTSERQQAEDEAARQRLMKGAK